MERKKKKKKGKEQFEMKWGGIHETKCEFDEIALKF